MSTLILACILNITPVSTGTIKYMPVTLPEMADADDTAKVLRAECSKVFGSVELAYLVKE